MQTHHGSCHCGAVTYTVDADIPKAMECNCSHCAKKGFLLAFIPSTQFTLTSGEDNLTDYQFNKKHIHHMFCKTCGVQCFGHATNADGGMTYAVNLRTIPDFDLTTLTIDHYDGKSV